MDEIRKVWVLVYKLQRGEVKLLALKSEREPGKDSDYHVITGEIEERDSHKQAAIRETEAEIGVTPLSILRLDNVLLYTDKSTGKKFTAYCFAAQVDNSHLTLNEKYIDHKWLTLEEFVETIWWIGSRNKLMDVLADFMGLISDNTD
jgi:8-oxo-dGTP pyrophosphatase MutT (NUDIX family)